MTVGHQGKGPLETLVISPQMGGHVAGGEPGIGVDAPSGRIPVGVGGREEAGGGHRERLGVRCHEVHLLRMGVVGAHVGQVRGVLVE